jgi:hypothetical protein
MYINNISGENMKIIDETITISKLEKITTTLFSLSMTALMIITLLMTANMTVYDKSEADRIIAQSK